MFYFFGNQFELSAHIEDGDLSDDDDLFEETSLEGFTTPLDEDGSIDEYDAFKNVFDGIQTKSPGKTYTCIQYNTTHSIIYKGLGKNLSRHIPKSFLKYV